MPNQNDNNDVKKVVTFIDKTCLHTKLHYVTTDELIKAFDKEWGKPYLMRILHGMLSAGSIKHHESLEDRWEVVKHK